jgi:hypothetical protein
MLPRSRNYPPFEGMPPATAQLRLKRCRAGTEPAEALPQQEREQLVTELWAAGWTDVEIAQHTRMTTYTTGRIRIRLGLAAHPPTKRGAAA